MKHVDLIVVGGGPAGMAAAVKAREAGVKDILVIERGNELGGILQQCIHSGFGLHVFSEELTGPEYAWRFISEMERLGIRYLLDTMVLDISQDKVVTAVNRDGLAVYKAKAVILSMGCRERSRGALNIPGTRPAGIYTAGTAQRFVNMEGYLPGENIVILGSGDIGLIMARRMTLEGAKVKMVCEILPYSNGLTRNIVQCLDDFGIPLRLGYTAVKIHGRDRLEAITVAKVDENLKPVPGTEEYVKCDTLLLSVGLIPENELSREAGIRIDPVTSGPVVNESMETNIDGIFACGNVVHVHDLVDYVTEESRIAGRAAAEKILSMNKTGTGGAAIGTKAGKGVRYIVPHIIRKECFKEGSKLFFRVTGIYRNADIVIRTAGKTVYSKRKLKVTPGEMETIRLTRGMMEKIGQSDEITVQIDNI